MPTNYRTSSLLVLLLLLGFVAKAQPNANFTTSNTEGCAPLTVTFTSSEQGSSFTHTWDFGNGIISNAPINPSRVYTAPGTYTVKHTITGTGGSSTVTKTNHIVVHPTPTVDFSANAVTGCPPLNVNFTDQTTSTVPGGLTYRWVLGNGATPGTSTSKSPSASYTVPGKHNVTLEVTNSKGCKASVTKVGYITVLDEPVVDFVASPAEFCPGGGTASFSPIITGANGPYTYAWTLGTGTSNLANPTHTYSGSGPASYSISLTVTAGNGCKKTFTKTNYIKIYNVTSAFTAPSTACVGEQIKLTNSSTAGAISTWTFGDGGWSNLANPVYTYYSPGTYTITLVSSMGQCTDTMRKTILVRPSPKPSIITGPSVPCDAPQTISFSTSPAMSGYNWRFNTPTGLQTSTSATPVITYTQNGTFPYSVTVKDQFGCEAEFQNIIDIFPLYLQTTVNGNLREDSGCVQFTANFKAILWKDAGNSIPYPHTVKSAKWTFGDGNTSTLTNPTHIYKDSGVFKVYVEIETINGCKRKDSLEVRVGYEPKIHDIFAAPQVVCPKNKVDFKAWVTGYKPLVYVWDFQGGGYTGIDDSTANHTYGCTDTFDVKLKVYHHGCQSVEMEKKDFIKVLPPCAMIKDSVYCSNRLRVAFTDVSKGGTSRVWDFGDGNTSTAASVVHTYAAAGVYYVKLVAHNASSGCYDSMTSMITVGPNPPVITANKLSLCRRDSVAFSAAPSQPTNSPLLYNWTINGNPAGAGANYTHTFTQSGRYTIKVVMLYVTNGCTDTSERINMITVGGANVGFSSSATAICQGERVQFTDTSKVGSGVNITQRYWDFGTNPPSTVTSASATASNTYPLKGQYDVKLIVTDNIGCKDSLIIPQHINVQKPVAIYTPKNPACAGAPTAFNNQSQQANTYLWDMGDGYTTTQSNPVYTYPSKGLYNTRLIAIDGLGCRDTAYLALQLNKPTADFTISDSMSVCPPLITNFDGSPSVDASKYTWFFDDGSSPGTRITHTVAYNDQKAYNVRLVVTDAAGCTDTATKQVQVLGYSGAFKYSPKEGCAPLTVDFVSEVKGSVPTMIWDFGDGNTQVASAAQLQVSYTYRTPGKYIPRMIFSNNKGCSVGSDGLDTIIVDGVTPDFLPEGACQFSKALLHDKSVGFATPVTKTEWTFHDGSKSTLSPAEYRYGPPGNYRVKLVVTNARGCIDSIEKDVTVHVPLEAYAGGDTIICLTDSIQLFPSGGVSYRWLPSNTLSCLDCSYPFAFPKGKTKYTVISTDINGCHDTAALEIGVKTHVVSVVGEGGKICEGESLRLTVSGARTYAWTPSNSLDDGTSPSPIATPKESTVYRVVAYEGKCIPDTSLVEVTVYPKPTVTVRGEQTIVAGTSADLIASGTNIVRFLWDPAATLSCAECADPIAKPYKTTRYQVKVFTRYNCVDSAFATIKVLCDKSQLYVPNTFTPNGDGVNDIFMVRGTGITSVKTFRIYSRWGEVLFERNNIMPNDHASGWDGTYNGSQLAPDVYVYTVEAYCENGDLLVTKGDITIIR